MMNKDQAWFEIEPDIQIDTLGEVRKTNRHPDHQGVPYWILVLVEKGERTLYANHQPLCVGAHQFFLLPPYTNQKPWRDDEHAAFFIHFYAKGKECPAPVRVKAERIILPSCGYLPTDFDCFMHLRYLRGHTLTPYANSKFLSQQVQALLMILSLQCQRHPHSEQRKGFPIDTLSNFIKENACLPLRAEDYEAAFGKSYHHLNLLFKQHFGTTVKQYHMRVRMQYAAGMLLSGSSLQETAEECGFDDYFFFINSFTKVHGISPAAYRKLHGG